MIPLLFTLAWLASSLLSYGLFYAYFRHISKRTGDTEPMDRRGAMWLSWVGPISLVIALALSECGEYGVKWRRDIGA